ncbi:hypothetical protein [Allokutzneria oryzae]|uniref:PH domain-containing protein n=1 Tax=Allokutzneria oryzae TaxID=1378989 RepID=A0ABV5ZTG4_9PSEU
MVPLDLIAPAVLRRRAVVVAVGGTVLALLVGALAGLLTDPTAGTVLFVVIGVPPWLLSFAESRRRTWLAGTEIGVRALSTTKVDLTQLTDLGVLVSQVRGIRTVGLLVTCGRSTVTVPLAAYAERGIRELDLLALRKLADALIATGQPSALVFSELLVAQLRAEARGAGLDERPLFLLAAAAQEGRLAQRLGHDVVSRFVASME